MDKKETAVGTKKETKTKPQTKKLEKAKTETTAEKATEKKVTSLNLDKPIEVDKAKAKAKAATKTDTRSATAKFLNLKKSEKEKLDADIQKNKKWAWTAYILFFIPLLIDNKSNYMRLHANEGLDTNLIDLGALLLLLLGTQLKSSLIFWQTAFISMFFMGIGLLFMTTVTKIFMIVQSIRGKKKQTPWLWKARIIKRLDEKKDNAK